MATTLTPRTHDAPASGSGSDGLNRRELLTGAGAAALVAASGGVTAQTATPTRSQSGAVAGPGDEPVTVVFTHTTVIVPDGMREDVALAVVGDRIAAIGPTDEVLRAHPRAAVYDGRGKALLPGLINCHAHLAQTLARGFNEDFGFPNSYRLAVQPTSLISREENALMAVVGAIEAIRTGSTTVVENVGGTASTAAELVKTGLRWVFAESATDRVGGSPMSPEILARGEAPQFSAQMRNEGLQRIADLHSAWHGRDEGRVRVFPAAALAENSSPELLQAVRAFADRHELPYTIHLSQSRAEVDYMRRHHGMTPPAFLQAHGFLGPRLFAAHCRYVDDADIALLGRTGTIVSHQPGMAGNRGVIPPIPALRAAGCTIAMGTDNNTTDLFEAMRIGLVTERVRRDDAFPGTLPQPEDILADATLGSARAVGLPESLGALEVGRKADLLVLDTRRAHLVPAVRILSAWMHNGQPGDIESVMIDGRFVMRDRRVLTVDEPAILAEAEKVGRRVWAEVQKGGAIRIPRLPRRG